MTEEKRRAVDQLLDAINEAFKAGVSVHEVAYAVRKLYERRREGRG